jgi:hypothetical protein
VEIHLHNRTFLLLPFWLLLAQSAAAQQFEKILLPIMTHGIAGAYGSFWKSDLVVLNHGVQPFLVVPELGSCGILCPDRHAKPGVVYTPETVQTFEPFPTVFLFAESGHADELTVNLRIQDVSRQALTWGTEIPVVRERDVFTGRLDLINVPLDARFRQALRVYDFDSREGRQVRLQIYGSDPSIALVDTILSLTSPPGTVNVRELPGYAQISPLADAFPQLAGQSRVRLQLTPVTEGLRFWAFVSVTNDETQHVTTIAPR